MDLKLKDKVALVTGAGSQIGYGRGIARTLAEEGCKLVISDIKTEGLQKTAEELEAMGASVLAVKADNTNRAEVDDMVKKAIDRFGQIDVLVNNAGASGPFKMFVEMTTQDWSFDINVNLYGQMNVAQAVLPYMLERKYGRIINFAGGQGIPGLSTYGAAKAGVIMFSQSLAKEVAPHGIVVNILGPGLGMTGLVEHTASAEFLEGETKRSSLKRLCTPEDVGPAVAFLASDRCSYLNGQLFSLSAF
jgi:NAD(P)-dependent dehydrogenase (short-subunit alcohol dehydrogenase family)